MKKILLICTTSQSVLTFRQEFIKRLLESGNDVSIITFDSEYYKDIVDLGVKLFCVEDNNRSINPLKLFSLKNKIYKIIRIINPSIVLTFMLKPNIFGVRAASKNGIKNIYSMVEGVGDVYINNSIKWKIIRVIVSHMYKKSFKLSKKVIFLNDDNKNEFIKRGIVPENKCEIIPGVGVDIDKFSQKPILNYNRFLMIARMLKTKGLIEYCEAAKIIKEKYPDIQFDYLGAEGTIKIKDIKNYIDAGIINYLGTTKDVRPYLENCSVFVLPSYREGMSVSIMEAEAVGRAIITTKAPGCIDAIKEDYNGFIVPIMDAKGLSQKMLSFIENKELIITMGNNSRQLAVESFNSQVINNKLMKLIEN